VVTCPSSLLPLLVGCPGVDRIVPKGSSAAEAGSVQALLPSLPLIFGTTPDTVPAPAPYLIADPVRVDYWRSRFGEAQGIKIGIAWQGSPENKRDRLRSVPLVQFAPLAQLEGVRLYSLQVGMGREQLARLNSRFPITDLGGALEAGSFADTAAS